MYTLQLNTFIKDPYTHFLPGITPETIQTCSELLQQNHDNHHVFFDTEGGLHNHTTHYLLAALGVGASSQTLKRIYEDQKKTQLPLVKLHNKNEFDANKCLGDDNYYHDYLEFFQNELENGKYNGNIQDLIEDYLFNKNYLTLIFGGAYHSYIHISYALEFQSKLMAVEGLAMAAIDRVGVQDVLEHLDYDTNKNGDKTALEIIDLICKDQRFDDKVFFSDEGLKIDSLFKRGGGPLVVEYAQMWKCDANDLRRAGILVNVGAIRPKKAVRLDFFLMHATTSCLFVDIFVQSFKKQENQSKFLRAKFAVDLLYYVVRGRPKLNLNYLFNEYQPSKEHLYAQSQNPWLPLIDKCLTHPDEHVLKMVRSLMYAEKFDNIQDKDKIPYLKLAQMTMDALFPPDKKDWAHDGVGWDEYWKTVEDL